MTLMSRAMVQTGTRKIELREFPVPEIGDEDALLAVEACGMCGSDWSQYQGEYNSFMRFPVVPGHEPVGIINQIGKVASQRWGVKEGDRVVVEPVLPCGFCRYCIQGQTNTCEGSVGQVPYYSYVPIDQPPTALWGGYADYMYLAPNTLVHKVDPKIPPEIAALYNPLGAGVYWAIHRQGTRLGDTIVILGCGQRGLASVIAAKEAGCASIVVTGLRRDEHKLNLAREFGADHVVYADEEDVVESVKRVLPQGADIVLDTTPKSPESIKHAIDIVSPNGTIGLAGLKGSHPVNGLNTDEIMQKSARILGTKGVPFTANEAAVRMIESGRFPLEKMHTHDIPLEHTEYALKLLAGEIPGEEAIHICIRP